MPKLTISLDATSARAIQRMADDRRCSRSQIMREAVLDYLRWQRRPRIKGVGAYGSGRTDVSERAEELMREAARSRRWG